MDEAVSIIVAMAGKVDGRKKVAAFIGKRMRKFTGQKCLTDPYLKLSATNNNLSLSFLLNDFNKILPAGWGSQRHGSLLEHSGRGVVETL